jgi:hypothetical protein
VDGPVLCRGEAGDASPPPAPDSPKGDQGGGVVDLVGRLGGKEDAVSALLRCGGMMTTTMMMMMMSMMMMSMKRRRRRRSLACYNRAQYEGGMHRVLCGEATLKIGHLKFLSPGATQSDDREIALSPSAVGIC